MGKLTSGVIAGTSATSGGVLARGNGLPDTKGKHAGTGDGPPAPPPSYQQELAADSPRSAWPFELTAPLPNSYGGAVLADPVGGFDASMPYDAGTWSSRLEVAEPLVEGSTGSLRSLYSTVLSSGEAPLDTSQGISIEFWYKLSGAGQSGVVIQHGGRNATLFVINSNADGSLYANAPGIGMSSPVLNDGAAHHIVAVFGATASLLYVDGEQVAATGGVSFPSGSEGTHFFGQNGYNGRAYSPPAAGTTLDAAALYEHALSAARVAAHYAAGHLA